MSVAFTRNGDIELAYEAFGAAGGRPLLLIQGAGAPMLGWPDEFCLALVARGFQVVRFDNRDAGRSSRASSRYTLADMATDGVAVLDALGWPAAHLVGVSLGGMVAQTIAARHPARVLSLTSMSSAPDHRVRTGLRTLLRYLAVGRRRPRDPEAAGEQLLAVFRIIGSRSHPPDEDWVRDVARRTYPNRTDFAAARRQAAAVRAAGDRRGELARIMAPTLVLTGEDDPVQPVRAGRATAEAIPGARFVAVPEMGHDLPRRPWLTLVDHIDAVATR